MLGNKCPFPVTTARGGGNESPELSWTNVPRGTQSLVVIAYDVTASLTYWGMYNIDPANTTGLPENAGVVNSPFGEQVVNDLRTGATTARAHSRSPARFTPLSSPSTLSIST